MGHMEHMAGCVWGLQRTWSSTESCRILVEQARRQRCHTHRASPCCHLAGAVSQGCSAPSEHDPACTK